MLLVLPLKRPPVAGSSNGDEQSSAKATRLAGVALRVNAVSVTGLANSLSTTARYVPGATGVGLCSHGAGRGNPTGEPRLFRASGRGQADRTRIVGRNARDQEHVRGLAQGQAVARIRRSRETAHVHRVRMIGERHVERLARGDQRRVFAALVGRRTGRLGFFEPDVDVARPRRGDTQEVLPGGKCARKQRRSRRADTTGELVARVLATPRCAETLPARRSRRADWQTRVRRAPLRV